MDCGDYIRNGYSRAALNNNLLTTYTEFPDNLCEIEVYVLCGQSENRPSDRLYSFFKVENLLEM